VLITEIQLLNQYRVKIRLMVVGKEQQIIINGYTTNITIESTDDLIFHRMERLPAETK